MRPLSSLGVGSCTNRGGKQAHPSLPVGRAPPTARAAARTVKHQARAARRGPHPAHLTYTASRNATIAVSASSLAVTTRASRRLSAAALRPRALRACACRSSVARAVAMPCNCIAVARWLSLPGTAQRSSRTTAVSRRAAGSFWVRSSSCHASSTAA